MARFVTVTKFATSTVIVKVRGKFLPVAVSPSGASFILVNSMILGVTIPKVYEATMGLSALGLSNASEPKR